MKHSMAPDLMRNMLEITTRTDALQFRMDRYEHIRDLRATGGTWDEEYLETVAATLAYEGVLADRIALVKEMVAAGMPASEAILLLDVTPAATKNSCPDVATTMEVAGRCPAE